MAGEKEYRAVNSLVGEKPSLGPIPGNQVVPWVVIAAISIGVKLTFGVPWLWAGAFFFWGIGSWWILTGKRAWRFLNRFVRCPRWGKGYRQYQSPLDE